MRDKWISDLEAEVKGLQQQNTALKKRVAELEAGMVMGGSLLHDFTQSAKVHVEKMEEENSQLRKGLEDMKDVVARLSPCI